MKANDFVRFSKEITVIFVENSSDENTETTEFDDKAADMETTIL